MGASGIAEVGDHQAAPWSRSDSATVSAGRRRPSEHAARRRRRRGGGPAHAAQEQVEGAAEVALGGVVGQPPAQEAVQRHAVEQRLERVVGVDHRGGEALGGVVRGGEGFGGRAEPVGLVVDDDEAGAGQPQHGVDAAGEVAAQRLVGERRVGQEIGVAREGVVGGEVGAQQRGDLGRAARWCGTAGRRRRGAARTPVRRAGRRGRCRPAAGRPRAGPSGVSVPRAPALRPARRPRRREGGCGSAVRRSGR